jgi:hypothetical protein
VKDAFAAAGQGGAVAEGPDDRRERVGTNGRANDVVRSIEVDDLGAEGLVDCISQRPRASFNGNDLGA